MTGGTLTSARYQWQPAGHLRREFILQGTTVTINPSATTSVISASGLQLSSAHTPIVPVTFNVARGSAPVDLLISSHVTSESPLCSLTKTGAGTMAITGTCGSNIAITDGTLIVGPNHLTGSNVSIASGTRLVVAGAGLRGEYYDITPYNSGGRNPNFATLYGLNNHLASRYPSLAASSAAAGDSFDFLKTTANGTVGPTNFPGNYNLAAANFEVKYSGKIQIPVAGSYTFDTASQDGSMMWIDGVAVVNANQFQPWTVTTGAPVTLTQGFHDIVIGFYHATGDYGLRADIVDAPPGAGLTLPARLPNSWLSLGINITSLSGAGTVELQQAGLTLDGPWYNSSSTFSAAITGNGWLAVSLGTLTISGTNSYTGGTTISGSGRLNINSAFALDSGPIVLSGGTIGNTSGAALTLSANNPQTWSGNFVFAGPNDLNLGTGAVTLNGNSQITVSAGQLTVGGSIGGDYGLTKAGTVLAGTLVLTGNNTYTGPTVVQGGTLTISGTNSCTGGTTMNAGGAGRLNINSDFALGTGPLVIGSSGGTIGNTSGAAITLSTNNPQTWSGNFVFAGPNDLNLGIGAVTLNGNRRVTVSAGQLTVGGPIGGGYGLTKAGTGTLVLAGDNTYTGSTDVQGGALRLTGAAAGTSGVSIAAGGTIELSNSSHSVFAATTCNMQNDGTLSVTTAGQELASIFGTGTITVQPGATLTAALIVQNTLTIGAGGSVVIRETTAATADASQVPEPSTLMLLIAGASTLLAYAYRWRRLVA